MTLSSCQVCSGSGHSFCVLIGNAIKLDQFHYNQFKYQCAPWHIQAKQNPLREGKTAGLSVISVSHYVRGPEQYSWVWWTACVSENAALRVLIGLAGRREMLDDYVSGLSSQEDFSLDESQAHRYITDAYQQTTRPCMCIWDFMTTIGIKRLQRKYEQRKICLGASRSGFWGVFIR